MTNEKAITNQIKTTGDLRTLLANCAKSVAQGSMPIDQANALHKLAKNISDSLYSETKIAMFRSEMEQPLEKFGDLLLGSSSST